MRVRKLPILLALLLFFISFMNLSPTYAADKPRVEAKSKIEQPVLDELEKNEYVSVLVELSDQVDTAAAARTAKQRLETQSKRSGRAATSYDKKKAAHREVVSSLKTLAEDTQQGMIGYLDVQKSQGRVQDYKSFYIINMLSVRADRSVIQKLAQRKEVVRITLDEKIDIIPAPPPEPVKSMAAMKADADSGLLEWNIGKILADQVWSLYNVKGAGVVVGIIDTGVDWTHPELMRKWRGYNPNDPDHPNPAGNWFDSNGSQLPYDPDGHGTHVAGTILGSDPNTGHISGVAPEATWIAAMGLGETSDMMAACEFMLAPNGDPELAPDIVNNSWSIKTTRVVEYYREVIQKWRDAGIVPVFAAGNEGPGSSTLTPPGNYPESFSVAAVDTNNAIASFSSRGPSPYPGIQKPDIAAPGVNIRSAKPGGGYKVNEGTSMAAPHIAGTAALLLSADASLSVAEVEDILKGTATPATDSKYPASPNEAYGYGVVNALAAVSSVMPDHAGTISGQVLQAASDLESPELYVTADVGDEGFVGLEQTVSAVVYDNYSIQDVRLKVEDGQGAEVASIPMVRQSGGRTEAAYTASIPGSVVQAPGIRVHVEAVDEAGNKEASEPKWMNAEFGLLPGRTIDFEHNAGPLKLDGWTREKSVNPLPAGGEHIASSSGGTASEIELMVDMRQLDKAYLQFDSWASGGMLYGYYSITGKHSRAFEVSSESWEQVSVDLSEFARQTEPLHIRLIKRYPQRWSIDNLRIATSAPENPASVSGNVIISPVSQSVGGTSAASLEPNEAASALAGVKQVAAAVYEPDPVEAYPIAAEVTVVETGRTVRSDFETGSFTMYTLQSKNDQDRYTLRVSAPGFKTIERQLVVAGEQQLNFVLEPITYGQLTGHVVDSVSRMAIPNATLRLREYMGVPITYTGADGTFSMSDVPDGMYTMRVTAPRYRNADIPVEVVGNEVRNVDVRLEAWSESLDSDLLAYDDGQAEQFVPFQQDKNAWALRISPNGWRQLQGVSFEAGSTGGTAKPGIVQLSVHHVEASGGPGAAIGSAFAEALLEEGWNTVLLPQPLDLYDDVFVVVSKPEAVGATALGIGLDRSAGIAGRTFARGSGGYTPDAESDAMIRAIVTPVLPPSAVTDLNVQSHSSDSVQLRWTKAEGAASIVVEGAEEGGAWTERLTGLSEDAVSAAISGLLPNRAYSFRLRIVGGKNEGLSNEVSVRTDAVPFTGLGVGAIASRQIQLKWPAIGDAAALRVVQSADDGATWSAAVTDVLTSTSNTAEVKGLSPAQSYRFRLEITGGVHEGLSNSVPAVTSAEPIADLRIREGGITSNGAILEWTAADAAISVRLLQSADSGISWDEAKGPALAADAASVRAESLVPNQTYRFKLVVEGGPNQGESNSIELTTLSEPVEAFRADSIGYDRVTLSWKRAVGAASYDIDRWDPDAAAWKPVDAVIDMEQGTAEVSGLVNNTPYRFRLTVRGGQSDGMTVSVEAITLAAVAGIRFDSDETLVLRPGDEPVALKAIVEPDNAADPSVRWSITGPAYAEVTEDGKLSALRKGETEVTVTTVQGGFQAVRKIMVENSAPMRGKDIPKMTATAGDSAIRLNWTPYFYDPDGDALTVQASVYNSNIADAAVVGAHIAITPKQSGETPVTITVSDPDGATVKTEFILRVDARPEEPDSTGENGGPIAAGIKPAQPAKNNDSEQIVLTEITPDMIREDGGAVRLSVVGNGAAARVVLTPSFIADMQSTGAELKLMVEAPAGSYLLPVSELPLGEYAARLGVSSEQLRFEVVIAEADDKDVAKFRKLIEAAGGMQPIGVPLQFTMRVTGSSGQSASIDELPVFVERTISVKGELPPANTIVLWYNEASGQFVPVPTTVRHENGMSRVVFKRNGNSIYTVVRVEPVSFTDMSSHWAQQTVQTMATRQIVNGTAPDQFSPDRRVTRAEAVAMAVRALGLGAGETAAFRDVARGDWYYGSVAAAVKAGLISGYEDGSFRPEQLVTRQELAVIMSRMAHYAGQASDASYPDALRSYGDRDRIADWAKESMALWVQSEVLTGDGSGLKPEAPATRAELATMVYRLMKHVKFME
ncbi:S8 family serine peptidase [Paenibacillus chartarius]|uniref:S8 family serine peptidase n=1 Tax=Paenibacillus chartarius TaxID=747481 RepID=A0ABV6DLD1_9BACL